MICIWLHELTDVYICTGARTNIKHLRKLKLLLDQIDKMDEPESCLITFKILSFLNKNVNFLNIQLEKHEFTESEGEEESDDEYKEDDTDELELEMDQTPMVLRSSKKVSLNSNF